MISELGIVWLYSPILFSFLLLFEFVYSEVSLLECLFASVPFGYAISNWVTYAISCYFGRLTEHSVQYTSNLFIALSVILTIRVIKKLFLQRKVWRSELANSRFLIIIIALFGYAFWEIYSTHYLHKNGDDYMSGGTTWGDMALHLDIINSFLKGENTKLSFTHLPKSPIFAGESLQYSFLPDFHAASFIITGATEREALMIPSLLLMISLSCLLFLFYRRISNDTFTSFIALLLSYLCGGVGFYYWITERGMSVQSTEYFDFVEKISDDPNMNLFWFATIPHILIPQRQAIYSLGLVVFILILLCIIFQHQMRLQRSIPLYFIAGFASSLLPTIQQHSFLSISFLVLSHLIFNPKDAYKPKILASWVFFFLPIIFFALPTSIIFGGKSASNGGDFFRVSILWADDYFTHSFIPSFDHSTLNLLRNLFMSITSPLHFWFRALWLFLPLSLIGSFMFPYSFVHKRLIFVSWILFLIPNFAQFQSWKQDNIKLFLIWMFIASLSVASLLTYLFRLKKPLIRVFTVYLFLTLIFSGSIALYREYRQYYTFYNEGDIEFGKWVETNTPPDAYFLTSQIHTNPVCTVAGRSIFTGYAGWLLSHGYYEYDIRIDLATKIFQAESEPSTMLELRKNKIDYVVIDRENINYTNMKFYEKNFQKVYDNHGYIVFKTTKKPTRISSGTMH